MRKMKFYVDADTLLYRSAALCQNNYDVIHKESGCVVTSVTSMKAFKDSIPKDAPEGYLDQFEYVANASPIIPAGADKPEIVGYHALKLQIEKIINDNKKWIDDIKIVLHNEGNFRNDIATIAPYKGNRKEKPIFFPQIKQWAFKTYKDILIVAEGEESDDVVSKMAFAEYMRVGENSKKFNVCIAGVDKDLDQIVTHRYNYDKNLYYWISRKEAAYNFYTQLLTGDSTDCIKGLVDLPPEIRKEYGLKGKGIGEKAAERLLEGLETPKEMMERCLSLYEITYKDKWYDVMEENCRLLYLRKLPNEMYDLGERLTRMGISYER